MIFLPGVFSLGLRIEDAKLLETNFSSTGNLSEETASIDLETLGPISAYRTQFLFDYDIFPRYIMHAETEWQNKARSMRPGDVIMQRVFIPPIGFGVCLEFAVRVVALFDEENKVGFSYETLRGHVEKGISEFYLEDQAGGLFFTIHTHSEPSHWMAKLFSPISTHYQNWCTQHALRHVKRRFAEENAIAS